MEVNINVTFCHFTHTQSSKTYKQSFFSVSPVDEKIFRSLLSVIQICEYIQECLGLIETCTLGSTTQLYFNLGSLWWYMEMKYFLRWYLV